MAELLFNQSDSVFKITGTGFVHVDRKLITPEFLKALVEQPLDSDFFLPDLCDILDHDSAAAIRDAFKAIADPLTMKKYQGLKDRFVGLQVGQTWDLDALQIVWRTKVETIMIDEIIRVKDGRAFVILTGSKDPISEEDLYRRTLKDIGGHLDSVAQDAATIAKYTKITLQAPIIEKKVCVHDSNNAVATISAWGPACLDPSQWVMPKGFTFLTTET